MFSPPSPLGTSPNPHNRHCHFTTGVLVPILTGDINYLPGVSSPPPHSPPSTPYRYACPSSHRCPPHTVLHPLMGILAHIPTGVLTVSPPVSSASSPQPSSPTSARVSSPCPHGSPCPSPHDHRRSHPRSRSRPMPTALTPSSRAALTSLRGITARKVHGGASTPRAGCIEPLPPRRPRQLGRASLTAQGKWRRASPPEVAQAPLGKKGSVEESTALCRDLRLQG